MKGVNYRPALERTEHTCHLEERWKTLKDGHVFIHCTSLQKNSRGFIYFLTTLKNGFHRSWKNKNKSGFGNIRQSLMLRAWSCLLCAIVLPQSAILFTFCVRHALGDEEADHNWCPGQKTDDVMTDGFNCSSSVLSQCMRASKQEPFFCLLNFHSWRRLYWDWDCERGWVLAPGRASFCRTFLLWKRKKMILPGVCWTSCQKPWYTRAALGKDYWAIIVSWKKEFHCFNFGSKWNR